MARRPEIVFCPVDRRNPKSTWLQKHRADVNSQNGEDGIIKCIFDVIGVENSFCVDFGAGDGERLSNSNNLVHRNGWRGVLIEPGDALFAKLQEVYRDNDNVVVIHDIVGFDDENKLDSHLAKAGIDVPERFDFLSIDIDGNDIYVWLDLCNHRPRVVCIEFNQVIPLDVFLRQPRDLSVNIGSSLLAITEHAKELGYELVATTTCNAFFVDRPLFGAFNIPDNAVESMHFLGLSETKLAQAYDGTLFLCGNNTHPWRKFIIDEERIQPLPTNMRKWKSKS